MTDLVVDASLAAQWVLREPHSAASRMLLRRWETQQVRRVVPGWFACEVGNIFFKRVVRGLMTLGQAKNGVEIVLTQVVVLDVEPALTKRALEFADQFRRSAAYDSQYLALAEHLGCELWTADERLWNSVQGRLPWVHWVGEVTASP